MHQPSAYPSGWDMWSDDGIAYISHGWWSDLFASDAPTMTRSYWNKTPTMGQSGRTCPQCGDCYRAVQQRDDGQARRDCGCVVSVVDMDADTDTADDETDETDTDGTVFVTLDEWIDSRPDQVATDGGDQI